MTPTDQDTANETVIHPSSNRCQSLSLAIQAIARDTGYDIDLDDLNAATGQSFMVTAVPDEPNLGHWMLYARDAFLVPAATLFGMTIRELHPPCAARGLRDSAEFAQHFDASYRPLILRALENGQPVLAWQGWAGDASMLWGVISDSCDKGAGFCGRVYDSTTTHVDLSLTAPPVQLYVIESITPQSTLDLDELRHLFLRHSICVLENRLCDSHGVITGPQAYRKWLEKLERDNTNDSTRDRLIASHQDHGTAVASCLRSVERFVAAHQLESHVTLDSEHMPGTSALLNHVESTNRDDWLEHWRSTGKIAPNAIPNSLGTCKRTSANVLDRLRERLSHGQITHPTS